MNKYSGNMPRRSFLKTIGAATAAGTALGFPQVIPAGVLAVEGKPGANSKLTFAHIGIGGMGGGHLGDMVGRMKRGECNIAALCDVDDQHLERASKVAGPQADVYRDYRYVLERKDIDAVIIATPDHWHGVQTVHAAERGKHVYVEKPACCTIEEGKAMITAGKKHKVAIQVGSQGRSTGDAYAACRYVVNGMIGKVTRVDCWHYASPGDGGGNPDSDPPPYLDWDLWLGPLRWRPYNSRYLHGVFRWFLESGGGQIRDRGAHVMSVAKYVMQADDAGPVTVEATGTAPTKGLWDTAVDMQVIYTFKNPDWVLTWNQPGKPVPMENGKMHGYGAVYHGSKGDLVIWGGDGGTNTEKKAREWRAPAGAKEVYRSPGHKEDWFNGIRTGAKTIMNIEAAVGVANLCILGNLSFILGRKLQWDQAKQEIVGDEEARRMMSVPQRYPYCL
jgi:predicted dehydrogenase